MNRTSARPASFPAAASAIDAIRKLRPHGSLAREMRRIRRAEIFASTALAGSALTSADVDVLLDAGRAQGGHPFADYVTVRSYAGAADWIAGARTVTPDDVRPLLTLDELRGIHARVAAGSELRGGAWRQGNPVLAAGLVAPAAWLVAREVDTLLARFGRGPRDEPVPLWIARVLGRFARLLPFEGGNGRTARLAANLMLRRLDIPPLVFEARDRRAYPRALLLASTAEPLTLAGLVAAVITRTGNRLLSAHDGAELQPLRAVAGSEYAALAKAAQRGRLRTIVRGGRYFTTAAWIAQYQGASPRNRADDTDSQPTSR